jgi:N-acetyl-beta-hexosaminidase
MAKFQITWEIEIDAPSHETAAMRAAKVMRDRQSTALHFYVSDVHTGESKPIDLNDWYLNGFLSKQILKR